MAGVVMAHTGFSALTMALSMPAGLLMLLSMIALGVMTWRHAGAKTDEKGAA